MNKFFLGFLAGVAAGYVFSRIAHSAGPTEEYRLIEVDQAWRGDKISRSAQEGEATAAPDVDWLAVEQFDFGVGPHGSGEREPEMDAGTHGSGGGEP